MKEKDGCHVGNRGAIRKPSHLTAVCNLNCAVCSSVVTIQMGIVTSVLEDMESGPCQDSRKLVYTGP